MIIIRRDVIEMVHVLPEDAEIEERLDRLLAPD
jgi:hypothetical protein